MKRLIILNLIPIPTGDSHAVRLMKGHPEIAVIGIRGGDSRHVKARLSTIRPRPFANIQRFGILINGNMLDRLSRYEKTEKEATRRTLDGIKGLASYIYARNPNADALTFDVIPRKSKGSKFNSRARAISTNITGATPKHSHIQFIKSVTNVNNRKHKRDRTKEKYPCVETFYEGGDGTHMNEHGYEAVWKIVEWAMSDQRAAGEAIEFAEKGWNVKANVKF